MQQLSSECRINILVNRVKQSGGNRNLCSSWWSWSNFGGKLSFKASLRPRLEKKQPFISSLFRWIIVHYLCYTLMPSCFSRDRCCAICTHILETVLAKSLSRAAVGKGAGVTNRGPAEDVISEQSSTARPRLSRCKPRLRAHTPSSNGPSPVDSQDLWSHLRLPRMHFPGWEMRCLWVWFIKAQMEVW